MTNKMGENKKESNQLRLTTKQMEMYIQKAVDKGIMAGRTIQSERPIQMIKAAEQRLYAFPILIKRLEDEKDYLYQIQSDGVPLHDKSILRFCSSGRRLSYEEIIEAILQDVKARIAATEFEIEQVSLALSSIQNDPYYTCIEGRYLSNLTDEVIAEKMFCDPSTIRRNRKRLLKILAIHLYGVYAIMTS